MYPIVVASLDKTVMAGRGGYNLCGKRIVLVAWLLSGSEPRIERDCDVTPNESRSRPRRFHVMWPAKYRFQAYRLYKEVRTRHLVILMSQ